MQCTETFPIAPLKSKRVKFNNPEVAMKDSLKLQSKLRDILRKKPDLKVALPEPASKEQLREIAWVVQDYVTHSGDVTNDDPLHQWLEEYQFFLSEWAKVR